MFDRAGEKERKLDTTPRNSNLLNPPTKQARTIARSRTRRSRSFPFSTSKNVVLHLDLMTLTAVELKEKVKNHIKTQPGFKALIISMEDENDELFWDDSATLASYGCEHETEISFFIMKDYEEIKKNRRRSGDQCDTTR
ncbi:hypothetical protein FN846DRAFT_921408 [Sphaerosporella brunnea]|uniref:Ubiquitin-like domain-containing protein n=1 Tax=Sphaerosporella brunnea TaxID=1250544 RepID=A0A5J5ENG8_9PEZI|nr:hypothetical protein FN846DRAFT_921408 [Sphaerosporella brunnea]